MSARTIPEHPQACRLALCLIEDLAAFGSRPDGFDFEGFGILTEQARYVLRVAKGREPEAVAL